MSKSSAPPSVAENSPPPDTAPEGKPRAPAPALIVGRTYADAAVDVAKMLGRALPALLVAGGVVFAYFEYRKLQDLSDRRVAEAEQKSREQLQRELDAANAAMREAYRLSAELNGQMIGNAKTLIDLQTNMAKTSGDMVTELLTLKQRVVEETAKFADAQDQARSAVDTKNAAVAELAAAREAKQQVDLERATMLGELDRLKVELEKSQGSVAVATSKRAEDIRYLRAQLEALVQEIQAAAEGDEPVPEGISELAQQIRGAVLVDPAALLQEFARPGFQAPSGYFDALVGVEEAALAAAIGADVTFAVWVRVSGDSGIGYIACREQASDRLRDVIAIGIEDSRVVTALWLPWIEAVHLRNPEAWSSEDLWGIGEANFEPSEGIEGHVLVAGHGSPSWNLWDFIRSESAIEEGLGARILRGEVKEIAVVDWKVREREAAELYRELSASNRVFADALDVNRRAASFEAALALLVGADRVADEALRNQFTALLRGAVARDPEAVARVARRRLGTEELDPIAAAVLDDDFRVVGTFPDQDLEQTAVQAPPTRRGQRMSIETEYAPRWEAPRRVSFVFARDGDDSPWLLDRLQVGVAPDFAERAVYKK